MLTSVLSDFVLLPKSSTVTAKQNLQTNEKHKLLLIYNNIQTDYRLLLDVNFLSTCSHLDQELYCRQTMKRRTGIEIFNKLKSAQIKYISSFAGISLVASRLVA